MIFLFMFCVTFLITTGIWLGWCFYTKLLSFPWSKKINWITGLIESKRLHATIEHFKRINERKKKRLIWWPCFLLSVIAMFFPSVRVIYDSRYRAACYSARLLSCAWIKCLPFKSRVHGSESRHVCLSVWRFVHCLYQTRVMLNYFTKKESRLKNTRTN